MPLSLDDGFVDVVSVDWVGEELFVVFDVLFGVGVGVSVGVGEGTEKVCLFGVGVGVNKSVRVGIGREILV